MFELAQRQSKWLIQNITVLSLVFHSFSFFLFSLLYVEHDIILHIYFVLKPQKIKDLQTTSTVSARELQDLLYIHFLGKDNFLRLTSASSAPPCPFDLNSHSSNVPSISNCPHAYNLRTRRTHL